MHQRPQATLAGPAIFRGVGVHAGAPATATVRPAPAGHGRVFRRLDVPGGPVTIAALADRVVDTRNATVLGNAAGVTVSTGEHLLAALSACGIDNAVVDVEGPELPILAGDAGEYVRAFAAIGVVQQDEAQQQLEILAPVEVRDGPKWARLEPADRASFAAIIRFAPPIGVQSAEIVLTPASFAAEIAPARTFGFARDLDALHARGLGRGASLENCLAFSETGALNPGGLRWPNEPARHKLLDAIGDMALAGAPILGRYSADQPGHSLNVALVRALFAAPKAYRLA